LSHPSPEQLSHFPASGLVGGDREFQDRQRRPLRKLLRGLITHQTTQRAQRLVRSEQGELLDEVLTLTVGTRTVTAQQLLHLQRIVLARPIHLDPAHQIPRAERDLDVVVVLSLVQGVERVETQPLQFGLGAFPSGEPRVAQLPDQGRNPSFQIRLGQVQPAFPRRPAPAASTEPGARRTGSRGTIARSSQQDPKSEPYTHLQKNGVISSFKNTP
jgi:hypothetical protein